jgi:CubicO group peptidase (beta-lactamase class C family)
MKRIVPLACIVLVATATGPAVAHEGTVDVQRLATETRAFLEELNAFEELSLAIMISRDGSPVLEAVYGMANRSFGVPNRIDTRFNLASMNKMFTAVGILRLVQEGLLDLDTTVGAYLPDYPNEAVRNTVTVHQLLTHTAGMGNIFGKLYGQTPVNRYHEVEDYLPLFVDEPLRFEPGTRYEYSNAGYVLLGYLIEKVSGRNYHDYIRDNVFTPAGMADTDCYDVEYPVPGLAIGYSRSKSGSATYEYRTIEFMKMTRGGPAGGGYSTVGDLTRFGVALFEGRILDEEHTELLTSGKVAVDDTPQAGEYCYGLLEQRINGHRVVGHSGNFSGIRATLKVYPDDGIILAILSNFDRDQGAEELEYFVRERINGATDFGSGYLRTRRIIRSVAAEGTSAVLRQYGEDIDGNSLNEGVMLSRGYSLLKREQFGEAIELLRFCIEVFPGSSYAHHGLAVAFRNTGETELALSHCRRALEIEPELEAATRMLAEMVAGD